MRKYEKIRKDMGKIRIIKKKLIFNFFIFLNGKIEKFRTSLSPSLTHLNKRNVPKRKTVNTHS